ncbi:unnamed protein product [Vicia faba]|uniref:Uncharacterized protein n=1 Tax=Vicia faba TaxID=3906 RepID=A0AAV1AZQ5_VICFA|nr:unnamed protein product [Vicia faba]
MLYSNSTIEQDPRSSAQGRPIALLNPSLQSMLTLGWSHHNSCVFYRGEKGNRKVQYTYGLAMWYGSMLVLEKGYTGGTVMSVIIALMTGGMSLGQKSPCIDAFTIEQVAAYKMFETIKRKPKIDAYDTSGEILEDIKGDIELKDVYFRYPARPDVKIFVGFSLFVPSGITTALCGTKQERLLGTSCNDNHLIPRSFLEVSFSSSSLDESSEGTNGT